MDRTEVLNTDGISRQVNGNPNRQETTEQLHEIASFGYGVYTAQGKVIIADPLNDADGFGVTCDTLGEAYEEWKMLVEMLTQ